MNKYFSLIFVCSMVTLNFAMDKTRKNERKKIFKQLFQNSVNAYMYQGNQPIDIPFMTATSIVKEIIDKDKDDFKKQLLDNPFDLTEKIIRNSDKIGYNKEKPRTFTFSDGSPAGEFNEGLMTNAVICAAYSEDLIPAEYFGEIYSHLY